MSRRKTIRPSVEAGPAKLLVLLLCSPPAPPLAEFPPPQAANEAGPGNQEGGPAKLLVLLLGAVPPLLLLLCSWPAPPLAEFSPPQAANNSRQSPMRRPITSHTRRDGFPISEWYIPCSCSRSVAVEVGLRFIPSALGDFLAELEAADIAVRDVDAAEEPRHPRLFGGFRKGLP